MVVTAGYGGAVVLWDAATGRELRRMPVEHRHTVLAFAPDGKTFASGGPIEAPGRVPFEKSGRQLFAGGVCIWRTTTGELLHRVRFERYPTALAFSPDGAQLLVATYNASIHAVDTRSGRVRRRFGNLGCHWVGFSKQDKSIVTYSTYEICVYTQDGQRKSRFGLPNRSTSSSWGLSWWPASLPASLAPDGKHLLVPTNDGAVLFELARGRVIRRYEPDHMAQLRALRAGEGKPYAFSGDGKQVYAGGSIFEAASGKYLGKLPCAGELSPDGTRLLSGTVIRRLDDTKDQVELACRTVSASSVDASRDGRRLLVSRYRFTSVWDLHVGECRLRDRVGPEAVFSPDGERLAVAGPETLGLGRVDEEEPLRRFQVRARSVAFTPHGSQLLVLERKPTLRDATSAGLIRTFNSHSPVRETVLSPDGSWVAGGCKDGTVWIWETATGAEITRFQGDPDGILRLAAHPDGERIFVGGINANNDIRTKNGKRVLRFPAIPMDNAVFSRNGRMLATTASEEEARLWSTDAPKQILSLGRAGEGNAAFLADGRHVFVCDRDGTVRIRDIRTGKELCSLVEFEDGSWAVVDPQGRFDASNGGDLDGVYWKYKGVEYGLGQLMEHYYDPGLLSKLLGYTKEPLLKVPRSFVPKPPPKVKIRVVVKLNGKVIADNVKPGKELNFEQPVRGDPRQLPGMRNIIEVYAYNADGTLRSRGVTAKYTAPGKIDAPARLFGVVVGTADYEGDQIDLRYAAKDAADFATALRVAAGELLGKQQVSVKLVANGSRAELVEALNAVRGVRSHDILVLYLAGHGVSTTGDGGEYFYLTREATSVAGISDPEVRARTAISGRKLAKLLNEIPATRQVMVLDTCAAGGFVDKLEQIRRVPSSQIRALHRLKERTGFHILAGCAADKVSYEASRFAQGLLTYSLLMGMRGAALREEKFVDVLKLFGFSVRRVPKLADTLGGIQRPVLAVPRGLPTFDIGRLEGDAKAKVPLKSPLPMVLRSNFQDETAFADVLELGPRVNARLRKTGSVVFVDAAELPGALRVVGRYRVDGASVKVAVRVFRGKEPVSGFEVAGDKQDSEKLAGELVDMLRESLR
jgi:WD40 repeat protein